MVGHSEQGNRDCRGTTGPCEDKFKLVPGQWVDGESVRSNVEKKSMNSDKGSFSGWILKSPRTSSVLFSGEQLRRASILSKKSERRLLHATTCYY